MFEKIMNFFRKIFHYHATTFLPECCFEGVGSDSMGKNYNIAKMETIEHLQNNIKFEDTTTNNEVKKWSGVDLISYALEKKQKKEEGEEKFGYDENKVQEMNEKIDYYMNYPEKLYTLPVSDIQELNFYFEKRIEMSQKK